MTRDLQLTFCLICTNRQFSTEKGVLCGLTKKQADFKENCKYFTVDRKEYQEICNEKIKQYGLIKDETKKSLLTDIKNEFTKEATNEYRLTRRTGFVKPRHQSELDEIYHFKKSIIKYGLVISFPLTISILGFTQALQSPNKEGQLYTFFVFGLFLFFAVFLIVDFFRNKNEFSVSELGIHKNGQIFPWTTILATLIMKTPTKIADTFLVVSLATKDIQIKLNGLIGMTEHVDNVVELYKERYKASNKILD